MSTRRVQSSAIRPRTLGAATATAAATPWVRNPAWLSLTAVSDSEQRFRGLVAVFPKGSYLALSAAGDYTVDWGDGSSENVSSGVTALKLYDFNDVDLANTNAPVTLTDAGDLIERTAHGYSNGMEVRFYDIVSTTGLTQAQVYYVINATANNFQVSATVGGSAIALTTNGSATLLPYKQAIVNVTPQAGQNITTFNLNVKHTAINLQAYETGWLDLELSGPQLTASGLTIGVAGTSSVQFSMCERAALRSIGNVTSLAALFQGFFKLREPILGDTALVTNLTRMFASCLSLTSAPLFNTAAVTTMELMFNSCRILTDIPLFNTASVISMLSMFSSCTALRTVPVFNTAAVINMSSMFNGCTSLNIVPLFNTAAVTSMSLMFSSCSSLATVPLFNTAAVIDMSFMFNSCISLTTVPLFNTAAVTNMQNMFTTCSSLVTVPLFNTVLVTNMSSMFSSCSVLSTVPLFNTAAAITMASMFSSCLALTSLPLFNTATVTNMQNLLVGCSSLTSVPLLNTAAVTNMQSMFNGCISLPSVPLFNTAAVTNMSNMFTGCSCLSTVPLFNTAGVTNMTSVFLNCVSLTTVPLFNTALAGSMPNMFGGCRSLTAVPALNVSAPINSAGYSSMFSQCSSLARIEAKNFKFTFVVSLCRLGKTELEEIFTNLPTVATAQTITITSNVGLGTSVTARSTTRTAQSTVSTLADTSSLANGMLVIGTGTGISTGITVVSDVSADTLTLISHGLPDGTPVAFSSLGTTTGVSLWTIYYVVSTAADTFQVATTIGGAAIDLTGTGGNMVVRYANYITNIVANTSITTSTPMATTGTGNLDYRTINTAPAMLKNWAVTY